jgi:hypothetical protein
MAVFAALVGFNHLVEGFTNAVLVERTRVLLDKTYTTRQATYDLRRLKRKGLIERRSRTQRYELTPLGRRVAVLFTKTYGRVLTPGLAQLDPSLPEPIAGRSPIATSWRAFERALEDFMTRSIIAA